MIGLEKDKRGTLSKACLTETSKAWAGNKRKYFNTTSINLSV